jgi:probable blue pigment (indigoidine) exporter
MSLLGMAIVLASILTVQWAAQSQAPAPAPLQRRSA